MGGALLPSILFASTGIYSKFNQTNEAAKKSFEKRVNKLINQDFSFSDIKDISSVKLDHRFITTLNFYTASRYMNMSTMDQCSIYDLFSTDLAKDALGELNYIIFDYEDKNGKIRKHALKKNIFLEKIAYEACPKIKTFKQYFTLANISNLLKTIQIAIPKSHPQCIKMLEEFQKDPKSIYLCDIVEKVRKLPKNEIILRNMPKVQTRQYRDLKTQISISKKYKEKLNKKSYEYLESMCLGVNSKKKYCDDQLRVNYWSKMMKSNLKTHSFKHFCPVSFKNKSKLKECVSELNNRPERCYYSQQKSLQPMPDCNRLAQTLNISRLYTEYKDCPGNSGSEAVTHFSRVLNHVDNSYNTQSEACFLNSSEPIATFDKSYLEEGFWNVKLCYEDKLKRKKICYPTLMGKAKNDDLSLTTVVGKILSRLKGFNNQSEQCEIIPAKQYKPALLKYKSGCWIVRSQNNCFGTNCKFKVKMGEQEFTNFTYESNIDFDFFPNNFKNENKSIIKLLKRHKKKKTKPIRNISSFKRIFDKHPQSIFVGVGCAEALLPNFFKSQYINQCTITPFIVDGLITDEGLFSMVVRSSFDNVHAPRVVPWKYVFESISQYQKIQPLNIWSFYALY